jgi:hypothetical protein
MQRLIVSGTIRMLFFLAYMDNKYVQLHPEKGTESTGSYQADG